VIVVSGIILGVFWWRVGYVPEIQWIFLCLLLWVIWMKWGFKTAILVLPILFFLNLQVNSLFGIDGWKMNFNLEKINLTNPAYFKIIDRYRYDDVGMPYRLRMVFYQNWQTVFLWIDSTFKILSIGHWVRLLGFSGFGLLILGIKNLLNDKKRLWLYLVWILTVAFSSGMVILLDTKKAWTLATIPIVLLISEGVKNDRFKKYGWVFLLVFIVDVILK